MRLRHEIPYKLHGLTVRPDVPELEYYPWEDSWVHNRHIRYRVTRPYDIKTNKFGELANLVKVWEDFFIFKDRMGFWAKLNTTVPPLSKMHPFDGMQFMIKQEHDLDISSDLIQEYVKDREASCVHGLVQSKCEADFFIPKAKSNSIQPKLFLNMNTKFYDDQDFIWSTFEEITSYATAQNYYHHITNELAKVYMKMKWGFS